MGRSQSPDDIKFIPASDAAELFGYTRDYITILARTGKVRAKRLGRNWYVNEASVREFLYQQTKAQQDLLRAKSEEYKKVHSSAKPQHAEITRYAATLALVLILALGASVVSMQLHERSSQMAAGGAPNELASLGEIGGTLVHGIQGELSSFLASLFGERASEVAPVVPAQETPATVINNYNTYNTTNNTTNNTTTSYNTAAPAPQQSGISESELDQRLSDLSNSLRSATVPTILPASGGLANNVALTQIIDHLDGTSLSNITVNGVSGLKASEIPDLSQQYLSVAGGTLTGLLDVPALVVSSTTATSTFANGIELSGGCVSFNGNCIEPGGASGELQFNNGGTFGSVAGLTYSTSTGALGFGTSSPAARFAIQETASDTYPTLLNIADRSGASLLSVATSGLVSAPQLAAGAIQAPQPFTYSDSSHTSTTTSTFFSYSSTSSTASLFASLGYFSTSSIDSLSAYTGNIGSLTVTNGSSTLLSALTGYFDTATTSHLVSSLESTLASTTLTGPTLLESATTSGDAYIGGNLTVAGNSVTLGTSSSNLLVVNSAINSNLVPNGNKIFDLGSPAFFWRNGYIDSITVNNISAASTSIGGTASNSFTINSDNATADGEDMNLIFFRGTVVPNALLTWNSAANAKRFEFNQPLYISNQSGSTTETTLALKAVAGQTGDMLDIQNSSGANVFTVGANGATTIGSALTVQGALTSALQASTTLFSALGPAYFGSFATTSIDANGSLSVAGTISVSTTTATSSIAGLLSVGSLKLGGLASAILAVDQSGQVVATSSIGTSVLTGNLGTINGQTLAAGGSITITAASSTLLSNNNTFSGNNIFTGSTLLLASTTVGNGTQTGGLTINGGATTTGNAYFGGTESLSSSGAVGFNGDTFISRNGAGVLQVGSTASNASGNLVVNGFTSQGNTQVNGKLLLGGVTGAALYGTSGGNFGFGTSTPFGKFAISLNNGETYPGNNAFIIASSTASATSTLLTVLNNGNVGIGTSSPIAALSVQINNSNGIGYIMTGTASDGTVDNTGGVALVLSHNANANRQFTLADSVTGNGVRVLENGIDGYNYISNSRSNLNLGTNTTDVDVTGPSSNNNFGTVFKGSSGFVGIGTSSPYSLLSISNFAGIPANTPLLTIASTTGGASTSTLLTVLANGNVGVGTNNPSYPLHVVSSLGGFNTNIFSNGSIQANTDVFVGNVIGFPASSLYLGVKSVNGTNTFSFQDSSGNNAIPVAASMLTLGSTYSPAAMDVGLSRIASSTLAIGNGTTGNTSGTLVANSIGVGTTTPQQALEIANFGRLRVSGASNGGYGEFLDSTANFASGRSTFVDANQSGPGFDFLMFGVNNPASLSSYAYKITYGSNFFGGTNYGGISFSSQSLNQFAIQSGNSVNLFSGSGYGINLLPGGTNTSAPAFTATSTNIGIGTTSPTAEFAIQANNGTNYPNNTLFTIASSTASATTTLFSINNIGQATIGSSANPGVGLYVSSGDVRTNGNIQAQTSFSNLSGDLQIIASNNLTFRNFSNGELARFTSAGLLGIGTTSPGSVLSIQGVGNFVANATSTLYNALTVGGNLKLGGLASAVLAVDQSGQVVATSSIGTNVLTGNLGSINGQTLAAGSSITITAASSTLLSNNNTWTGINAFNLLRLTATTSALLAADANGNIIATSSIGANLLTGTLGVTHGGTGLASVSTGDLLYGSASNVVSSLPIGSSGQILTVSGGVPVWAANAGSSGSGGGQLLATFATSTGTNVQVVFTGASSSNPSYSNGVLTLPSNTSYFTVEVWGSGGGGGGSGTTGVSAGNSGNTSCFGTNSTACTSPSISASGGGGGFSSANGGHGGSGGAGSGGDINLAGGGGVGAGIGYANNGTQYDPGGAGGSAPRGGGGGNTAYNSAGGNGGPYGGGGGGGGSNAVTLGYWGGSGGGGGGYAYKMITNPSGSYYYAIGTGGTGGSAGSGGFAGGNGGNGGIVIQVYTTGISNGSVGSGTTGQFAFYNASGTNLSATSSISLGTNSFVGIGTTTPWQTLSVNGNLSLTGSLYDGTASAGSNGYVLQSTGTGTKWVATSTLGFAASGGSGGGQLLATYATSSPGSNVSVNFNGAAGSSPSFSGGTLTLPSNTSYFTVEVWGGGGGGGGGGNDTTGTGGGNGGSTCFGTNSTACTSPLVQAAGGGGASVGVTGSTYNAGLGGAAGSSVGDLVITGGGGQSGGIGPLSYSGTNEAVGGVGGSAPGGGGGGRSLGVANGSAGAPFGGGGAGGASTGCTSVSYCFGGGGGGGGAFAKKLINNPSGTYYFTIGAGGTGGSAGTNGNTGAAGGAGGIVIEVYTTGISQGAIGSGTTGQFTFYNSASATTSLSATSSIFLAQSSNIGVGTTTPWANLSVTSSGQQSGTASLFSVASTTGARLFDILGNGNVGIGTTTPLTPLSVYNSNTNIGTNPALTVNNGSAGYGVISASQGSASGAVNGHLILGASSFAGGFNAISNAGGVSAAVSSASGAQFRVVSTADGSAYNAPLFTVVGSTGNVGIGTTTPPEKLSVSGGSIYAEGTGGTGRVIIKGTGTGGHQYEWYPDSPSVGYLGLFDRTTGSFPIVVNTSDQVGFGGQTSPGAAVDILGGGNTALNITEPNDTPWAVQLRNATYTSSFGAGLQAFQGNTGNFVMRDGGSGGVVLGVGGTSWGSNSDSRLKTNITAISTSTTASSSALSLIDALRPVTFNWKDASSTAPLQLGFIAQEVENVFPELVFDAGTTTIHAADGSEVPVPNALALNYTGLIAPAIAAIQELDAKVSAIAQLSDSFKATLVAWFADASNGIGKFFAAEVHTKELCVSDDSGETCVTRAQLNALLAGAAVSGASASASDTQAASASAVEIVVQGNNPAIVELHATYADLGAIASTSDQAIKNLGVRTYQNGSEVTTVSIDTSVAGTSTVEYKIVDGEGNVLASASRTVIVEDPNAASADASATSTPATAASDSATTTPAAAAPVADASSTPSVFDEGTLSLSTASSTESASTTAPTSDAVLPAASSTVQ